MSMRLDWRVAEPVTVCRANVIWWVVHSGSVKKTLSCDKVYGSPNWARIRAKQVRYCTARPQWHRATFANGEINSRSVFLSKTYSRLYIPVNYEKPDRTMIVRSGVTDSCLVGEHRKKQPKTELLYKLIVQKCNLIKWRFAKQINLYFFTIHHYLLPKIPYTPI